MRWGKKKGTSYGYLCVMRCNRNNIFLLEKFHQQINKKLKNKMFLKIVNHQKWE
jgi:hypothetical protein